MDSERGEPATSEASAADIRLAAMNLLARREHSRTELHRKLCRRFDDMRLLDTELQRLSDENLQSDLRCAESTIRARAGKGYGPLRIRQEMREKGIPDSLIDHALATVEVDWWARAEAVWRKKFGMRCKMDLKEKARRVRFMEYRGFSVEHYQHLADD